jgi:hypothetical protein
MVSDEIGVVCTYIGRNKYLELERSWVAGKPTSRQVPASVLGSAQAMRNI